MGLAMESASLRQGLGQRSGSIDELAAEQLRAQLHGALGSSDVTPDMLQRLRLALGDARKDAPDPRRALGLNRQGLENLVFAAGQLDSSRDVPSQHPRNARLEWQNVQQILRVASLLRQNSGPASTFATRQRMHLGDVGRSVLTSKRMRKARVPARQGSERAAAPDNTSRLSLEDRRRFGLDPADVDQQHTSPNDGLAVGTQSKVNQATGSEKKSSLSPEDRHRFGLDAAGGDASTAGATGDTVAATGATDDIAPGPVQISGTSQSATQQAVIPRWSSLTAEDRRRFGLLDEDGRSPDLTGRAAEAKTDHRYASIGSSLCADVLWGEHATAGIPGSGLARSAHAPTPGMARTLAQLEAVGMTRPLPGLRATEQQLWAIKLRG